MLVDNIFIVIATVIGSLVVAFFIESYRDKRDKDRTIHALYEEICYNKKVVRDIIQKISILDPYKIRQFSPLHTSSYEQSKLSGFLYKLPRIQHARISKLYYGINTVNTEISTRWGSEPISPVSGKVMENLILERYGQIHEEIEDLLKDYPEIEKPIIRWMDIDLQR